jgi:predicted ester cyclase
MGQPMEHALIAEGDLVAGRWTVYGIHQGPIGPFPPTGKWLEISGLSIFRVANGRIVEGWVEDSIMLLLARNAAEAEAAASAP